ncbi:MAG: hypothetical protein LC800_17820 [Acidobacteria bacterium]|nr:hypothetical protein [Acidobacteriota bacterium]
MKLPNAGRAVVGIGKLRDYSLSPKHEVGKHKARVFRAALGLTADDAAWLRESILRAVAGEEVESGPTASPFGDKYVVDITVGRGGRSAVVRTTWIIERGTDFPRLTSCYVR